MNTAFYAENILHNIFFTITLFLKISLYTLYWFQIYILLFMLFLGVKPLITPNTME